MRFSDELRIVFAVLPILGLLAVGLLVSLQSGVVRAGSRQGMRLLLCNFSRVLIRVGGFLAGMVAIRRIFEFPVVNLW